MKMLISYPISIQSPLYPGTPPVTCHDAKSIVKGDRANTMTISLSSHTGTHIDAPRHFCPGGMTTKEVLGEKLKVSPVYCIDIVAEKSTAIRISDLQPHIKKISNSQGIFIRTGMFRYRKTDPEKYCSGHPWIHPEIPEFLRTTCPKLRLFGTDTISISNPQHREDGTACHRAFLCGNNSIILAEDLDLSDQTLTTSPLVVIFYPWIVNDMDGVPVLAFAESVSDEFLDQPKLTE